MADSASCASEQPLEYSDGYALMANGPEALHSHVSKRIEIAMGRALPQMEVRFKDLSITADMLVEQSDSPASDLPTIAHELKNGLRKLGKASKHQTTRHILQNVNGYFKPGTLTLVLGQPGSGKSALMKVLSGRFPLSKNVHVEGEISYNGTSCDEIKNRLPQFVNYVTQRDFHFPTLTVKETLEFAHECCGSVLPERVEALFSNGNPEENQAALDATRALYKHRPDVVLQSLGLEHCQDTIVGNGMLRGVSGGERKRVTTGEMQFGAKFVTFMDEISTGLDSAATYDIIKTQKSLAKKFRRTIVIALLQPSPEVFNLFDDLLILNKGRVMYHGPRAQAIGYFEQLGFVCPPRRDHADFLLDLGTPQQYQYQVARTDKASHPRTPREFAELFAQSSIHDAMLKQLHAPIDPVLLEDNVIHFQNIPEFHQSFLDSTRTLMARQLKITLRNTAFIKGRALMVLIMGFFYSTVFWQVDPKNPQVALGIMFSAVLFLALGQASQIPTFMNARDIFYKQRGANFFRTSSYVLANSVSQLPLAAVETFVFGSMVYWMCGFVPSALSYIIFLSLLLLTNLALAACFFCLAALAPDLHIAKPLSLVAIMVFIIFAGFIVPANQIPDYFIWAYWVNPIAWCLRSLAINQYRSDRFNVRVYQGVNYFERFGMEMGDYSLHVFDIRTEKMWLWYGMFFMVASYVLFMTLSYFVLEFMRYESPEQSNLTDDVETYDNEDATYALVTSPTSNGSNKEVVLQVDTAEGRGRYFVPVTVAFRDLWYSVPNPTSPKETIDLLKGISGFAAPGTITALMGSSGAGKTTLMDVIAGRKTGGQIRGDILLNGHAATDLSIRRCTGYCEQMDIHSEASTIREALTFSAFLRQGSDVPDSQKLDSVEECLELLDMGAIADQIIRGSSVEQMKRLTIGVELAAQPSVLFLDEPTSGLDARSAKVIMDGVRKVANTGRTVLCTIHQPSSEVFQVFDSLLLLKRGGETVFFGELGTKSSALIQYFESMEGVTPLEDGYNPATWMLEVIGAGVGNANGDGIDFVAAFKNSEQMKILADNLDRDGVARPAAGSTALDFKNKRAATEATQAAFLMKRFINMYWRTPSYNLTRMVVCIVLALLFGFTFIDGKYDTYQGINAGQGLVFVTTIFVGVVAFNSVLPIASEERAAFYRERASQTYNALWYFVGITFVEIPYIAVSSLVFCGILYPMVGFKGVDRFFYYWLNTAIHVLLQTYAGQLLAFAMPSVEVAAIVGVLMNSIFFLFMGFNPPAAAIPSSYKWLYHITPQKYTLSILSGIVFGDCPPHADATFLGCQPLKGTLPPTLPTNMTIQEYAEDVFLVKHSDMWTNFTVILGFIVVFRLLALLALRFLNHQKR